MEPEEEKILNQNTEAVVPDPLYLIPEPLKGKEPTVQAPVLPYFSLREPDFNVLEEILQQEGSNPFAVESREEEKMELMKDTLNVLVAFCATERTSFCATERTAVNHSEYRIEEEHDGPTGVK